MFSGHRILVTGIAGFTGYWLGRRLVAEGAEVHGLVPAWEQPERLQKSLFRDSIILHEGDICQYEAMEKLLREKQIDSIFHLAGVTTQNEGMQDPFRTFTTNIQGTLNLLELTRQLDGRIKRLIVASSDKVYGDSENLPYQETHRLNGAYPYDVSKVCIDQISLCYSQNFDLPVGVVRLANIYGGWDLNWTRLVPGLLRSMLLKQPFRMYKPATGNAYRRDYLFVEDLVDGYLALWKELERKDVRGQAYNFGTDQSISSQEMIDALESIAGEKLANLSVHTTRHEILQQRVSYTKAHTLLNWHPNTTMQQGLEKAYNWYREYFERVNVDAG